MINAKLFKFSKRLFIILLVAVFSIVGIVSCSGVEDISGSRGGDYGDYTEDSEDTGVVTPDKDNPSTKPTEPAPNPNPKPTFPANTYTNIYTPWIDWNPTNVSWQDTNTLTQLWKNLINNDGDRYGRKWCIRDGDNRIVGDFKQGNYYYFDDNFDIVHSGKYADNLKVKQFLGGVIVMYSRGKESGTWTVGGLYKTLLNKEKNNSKGQKGYTKYENDNLNEFMRAIHRWEEGDLSVILMNIGYDEKRYQAEYGIDEYYCTVDDNYRKKPEYFLGKNPTNYLGTRDNVYWQEKLNVRVNHSWNLDRFNFTFIYK